VAGVELLKEAIRTRRLQVLTKAIDRLELKVAVLMRIFGQ
jgi:hypothetical protein